MFRNLFLTAHKAVASFLTFYFKTQSVLSCATCFHRETLENPNAQLILYALAHICGFFSSSADSFPLWKSLISPWLKPRQQGHGMTFIVCHTFSKLAILKVKIMKHNLPFLFYHTHFQFSFYDLN